MPSKSVKSPKRELKELKEALPFLRELCTMDKEGMDSTLKFVNTRGRNVLYQCFYNCIYNKSIPRQRRREIRKALSSKARIYEYLARPSNKETSRKKNLLKQTGAGLPLILATVLPLLGSLLQLT
jgi:hypothetical protein